MFNRLILSSIVALLAFSAADALAKKDEGKQPAKEQAVVKQEAAQPAQPRCRCCQGNCPWQTSSKPAVKSDDTPATVDKQKKTDAKAPVAAPGRGRGRGFGAGSGAGPRAARGPMPEVMATFHRLLDEHEKIAYSVKNIDGGVVTVTTSTDADVTELIRTHVRQMKQLLEAGRPIRVWDPLFVKLFDNADKIEMKIEDVKGGVKVTATSGDEEAVKLIRQHAKRGVAEFAKRGWDRAHEQTPLPE
jgi:uncharacterized protein YdcH (DUF465 family)